MRERLSTYANLTSDYDVGTIFSSKPYQRGLNQAKGLWLQQKWNINNPAQNAEKAARVQATTATTDTDGISLIYQQEVEMLDNLELPLASMDRGDMTEKERWSQGRIGAVSTNYKPL